MTDSPDDTDERRVGVAMVAGATLGAAVGTVFLDDVTQGVVGGVVAGMVVALLFPDVTDRIVEAVREQADE